MLIQSTQRMIEGNQGVSNNSKTLLKDPNVMGLLVSMLVVPKDHEDLLLTLLGEDAEVLLLTPQAKADVLLQEGKGKTSLISVAQRLGGKMGEYVLFDRDLVRTVERS